MTSLLQHRGGVSADGRKVELLAYLVKRGKDWERYNGPNSYNPNPDSTTFTDICEKTVSGNPVLYRFFRRPKGMFGPWVIFEYNGKEHIPDLSVPLALFKLPRDATRMTDKEIETYWKS